MSEPSSQWIARVTQQETPILVTLDDLGMTFANHIGDLFGIDCSDENKPFYIKGKAFDQIKGRIHNADYFPMDDFAEEKTNNGNEQEVLCTDRLRDQLHQWFIQNLPRLMQKRSYAIRTDHEIIDHIEKDIAETLNDYVDFGMINDSHRLSFNEVKTALNTMWEKQHSRIVLRIHHHKIYLLNILQYTF